MIFEQKNNDSKSEQSNISAFSLKIMYSFDRLMIFQVVWLKKMLFD